MSSTINIAIVGGSIAGCTLANGLVKSPNISFDVYDTKQTFTERGSEVSLAPNAEKAVAAMGLDPQSLFKEAGAMKMNSTYCLAGVGEHRGKPLLTLPGGVNAVNRVQWLQALLKGIPETRLHANKKLVAAGGYDAVIGCDGARSKIREIILGPEHQDRWAPLVGGYWDARGRMTPQDAVDKFGTELFDPAAPNEVGLIGNGAFLLFVPAGDGKEYHVIVAAKSGPEFDRSSWKLQLDRKFLEENYKDWDPTLRTAVIDVVMADDSGPGVVFSEWESPEAPSYYRGPGLAMMGDAAHATLPWLGQGACQATESAAILASVLRLVDKKSDITAALKAFDSVQRGRPEDVVRRSRQAARMLTGELSLDPDDVKHLEPEKWWTDVWNIDMEALLKRTIDHFHSLR